MQPILITGISGFIGGHVWSLMENREDVIGVYGFSGTIPLKQESQYFVDLEKPETLVALVNKLQPRCILHIAAISSPNVCQKNALRAWRVNHAAVRELVIAAEKISARVIITSSDQVFSGLRGYYREDDRPDPVNIYGETKKAAEKSLFAVATNGVAVRVNNTYGPVRYGGASFSDWILQRYEKNEPITLFKDQFRSPIDVITLSRALIELCESAYRGLIHIGGQHRLSRVQFGKILLETLRKETTGIVELSNDEYDPKGIMPEDTSFDISLARRILKTPIPSIREGIALAYGDNQNEV